MRGRSNNQFDKAHYQAYPDSDKYQVELKWKCKQIKGIKRKREERNKPWLIRWENGCQQEEQPNIFSTK